jgi:putative CocE/NonD family hydrolase
MKRLLFAMLSVSLLSSVALAQTPEDFAKNYAKKEVMITMRDGVQLFTAVYTPKDMSVPRPILLRRTPYSCRPYGEENFPTRFGLQDAHYAEQKYIIVYQDVRGRYMSEGVFEDVRPYLPEKTSTNDIDETSDTYDTVDWLVNNIDGNNGNVGIHGISYPGFYSWMGTIDAHPAMKATSPQAPVSEWMAGDDFYHNGAFMLSHAFGFYSRFGWPRESGPTTQYPSRFSYPMQDGYKFYLSVGAVKNFNATFLHDSVKMWNDISRHWTWDDFWARRTVRPHLKNIDIPVLVVGGWFDAENLYGALRSYESAEKQNKDNDIKLVMGPWAHGWWQRSGLDSLGDVKFGSVTSSWFTENVMGPYFDHYLDNKPAPEIAEATVFMTGENAWRQFDAWPPADVQPMNFYLRADGGLSTEKATDAEGYEEYVSDPEKPVPYTAEHRQWYNAAYMLEDQRFATRRPDVLVYQTDVLEEDVTIAGPITVNLFASTSGTDCDWVVKVIDVFPDTMSTPRNHRERGVLLGGYEMMVRGDVLRGKFRNSMSAPEPFEPDTPTQITYTLQDAFHRFKKGHRIMIHVQSSWFPKIDRNPGTFMNIFEADDADYKKTTQRVFRTSSLPSHIQFGVIGGM